MELLQAQHLGLLKCLSISADFQLVLDLQELIGLHFREHKDTEFYCERVGVPSWVLNPLCKHYYNKTVYALIVERMLKEAKLLLCYSRLSVRLIAFELGFADPGNFSRFFFREAGERPSTYRQKSRTQV